ncbi:hypothetical protein EX895_002613 [Sporisorium graminicola]|uniref:Zn(2)-C6 fungal-type domain-containing protein n=1 Tax=Sporisorium graminicola TaxID=280036 RepID=A0A4U7KVC7_9BASI|nr:hypothetical protein EX895_002613 [Sporisorium graminicola]TKY88624.1 hypothetical protein EX895_002613 [Sporisorium graminicola]
MQQQQRGSSLSPRTANTSIPSEPPEPPVKKKRKSPLFSKARSCIACRSAKLRCDLDWPCANCVRRGLAQACPGFVPHERRATSDQRAPHVSIDSAHTSSPSHGQSQCPVVEPRQDSTAQLQAVAHHQPIPSPRQQRQLNPTQAAQAGPSSSDAWQRPQYYGQSAHSSYLASNLPPPSPTLENRIHSANSKRPRRAPQDSWVQMETDYRFFLDVVQEGIDASIVQEYQAHIAWMFCPIEASKLISVFDATDDDAAALCLVIKVVMFAWQTAVHQDSPTGAERVREVAFQQCWRTLDKAQWSQCNSLTIQQALFLLCIFLLNFEGGLMSDRFSSVFGICVAKAIESGLYTDARVGQGNDHSIERQRQILFWELYSLDAFRSLAYCRPCFFQDATITAAKPSVLTEDDAFHTIKYENAQIINRFMTHHIHSSRTNFQETMDLDLQVRQLFERIPSHLRVRRASRLSAGAQKQTVRQVLQGCTIALNIHQTLLTLYRPWFVSTTLQEAQGKGDRQSAQYQRAKLCIGESASAMIDLCSRAYAVDPQTTMHWAFFLHHTFNAGVCRAMQAIYGHPSDPLYYSAVDDVDEAIELLDKTQEHGCGTVWLPKSHVLRKLRQRIDKASNGAARNGDGEQSRRASNFGLLGATVPLEQTGQSSTSGAGQQQLQPGAEAFSSSSSSAAAPVHSHDVGSAMTDETGSTSGWLDLLNTDAFTLSMADLWNAESLLSLEQSVNTPLSPNAAWNTPL